MSPLQREIQRCRERHELYRDREACIWEAVARASFAETKEDLAAIGQQLLEEGGLVVQAVGKTIEDASVQNLSDVGSTARNIISTFDTELSTAVTKVSDTIDATNATVYATANLTSQEIERSFSKVNKFIEEKTIESSIGNEKVVNTTINNINALTEGISIKSAELLTNVNTDLNKLITATQDGIRTDIDTTTKTLTDVATGAMSANAKTIEEITTITGAAVSEVGSLTKTLDEGVIPGSGGR